MKRIISILFVITLLAAVGFCDAEEQVQDWTYDVLGDGSAVITAYSGEDSEVVIPAELDGHPVTSLASDVFRFNQTITEVEIPENLTSFGDYVFLQPNQRWLSSYKTIGKPYILEPEPARILVDYFAEYAKADQINPFLGCYNLEKISVAPKNPVFTVVNNILVNKVESKTVSYPIGSQETGCAIPEGITAIGFQTFFGSNLESVSLPQSLAEIQQNPFIFSMNLNEITVSDENIAFTERDGVLVSADGTLLTYPMKLENASYTVPEGVKAIGAGAFFNNMALENVVLPEGVLTIGERAFDHCENLKTAAMPESLISIGESAFKNCDNLRDINLPGTVTWIDEEAFYNVGKQLVFTVEQNTYGDLWVQSRQYRSHFPGEEEKKSFLTQVFDKLLDENGELKKFHLSYLAESESTGYRLTRDIYVAGDAAYIIDEDEIDGVTVRMHKDNMMYELSPDSKTGKAFENKLSWIYGSNDVLQEPKQLYTLITSHVNRMDYTLSSRMLNGSGYTVEVFPEHRNGPEIAFYFDVDYQRQDVKLVYVYEEKYHGISPTVDFAAGELLFTINEFTNDFDESIFDISDYDITMQPK